MISIECYKVQFYSELDETSFSSRLENIKCIDHWKGENRSIKLFFKSDNISDKCFRELISLFFRYHIDMSLLAIFVTSKNEGWIKDKNAFWYQSMFKNIL